MILVDTSVWIDHLRKGDRRLEELLNEARGLAHPFIIGEIALGNLKYGRRVLEALADLPRAPVATDLEILKFIESRGLAGSGVGYLDAHLLASAKLAGALLWTRDKKLAAVAAVLEICFQP